VVTLLKTLEVIFVLFTIAAWVVGAYEQTMFYRAWRREKTEYFTLLAMLASDLSEDCRVHRRRAGWALVGFLGFLALGATTHFLLYGPDAQKPRKDGELCKAARGTDVPCIAIASVAFGVGHLRARTQGLSWGMGC
jgi:hypothetical protein